MEKIVVEKAFIEKYWEDFIEKALSHKYIRKIPNNKGGYYYIYPKDFAKPLKVLLSVFGMKEEKLNDVYSKQNIEADFGASKKDFAAHLLEYLSNRTTWNHFFSDRFNRDKYKQPVKFEPKKSELKQKIENGEIKNNGKTTDKTGKEHNETKEKDFKTKWNNSLMRKIYSMYNPVPEDKKVVNNINVSDKDRVSSNGRVGTIVKDYGNGFVFVNFDDGGFGKLNKKDLQNLAPTNQEVVNEAELNGEDVKEEIKQEEKPGYTDAERSVIALAYKKEHDFDPTLSDFAYYEKIKAKFPELAKNGDLLRTIANVKGLMLSSKQLDDAKKYIENRNKPVETENAAEEHENRSQAMMENQNARKLFSILEEIKSNMSPEEKEWCEKAKINCKKKTSTFVSDITGKVYSGEFYEADLRTNKAALTSERNIAAILASKGFEVYLLEEDNSIPGKKIDALVNGVPVDFKDIMNSKNGIRNGYHDGMKKEHAMGVIFRKPSDLVDSDFSNDRNKLEKLSHKGLLSVFVEDKDEFQNIELTDDLDTNIAVLNNMGWEITPQSTDEIINNNNNLSSQKKNKGLNESSLKNGEADTNQTSTSVNNNTTEQENVKQNDFESESEQEKHYNRSEAMMGNQNAKKWGFTDTDIEIINDAIKAAEEMGIFNDSALKDEDVSMNIFDFMLGKRTTALSSKYPRMSKERHAFVQNFSRLRTENNLTNAELLNGLLEDNGITYRFAAKDKEPAKHENFIVSKNNSNFSGDFVSENERKENLKNKNPIIISKLDYEGKTDKECRDIAKKKYQNLHAIDKDGIHIEFPMSGYRETKQHSADKNVLYVMEQLNEIMNSAIFMYREENTDPKKTDTLNMLNYANKINIDGTDYYVRLVIREDTKGNYYYDNDSIEVEKVKAVLGLNTEPNSGHHQNLPYINRITQWLLGVKQEINNKHDRDNKKLSEAMRNNNNAAGKHNVQPQTESQMKEEQKKTEKAREKAGLKKPGLNYGERVSAMEDSVSLNPNAENYAYKDTGYIAGSQKEKIQDFWKRKKESGEGTSIEEIDWNTLEENPRYAEQQITKANILGDIDYTKYQEKGMDPRVAYLIGRVFAVIPKEPAGHDVNARKNYVIAINTIKSRLEDCKTISDVIAVTDDIYGEYKQTYDSQIARDPKVKELAQQQSALRQKANDVRVEIMEWARDELIPAYKAKAKKERVRFYNYRDEIQKKLNEKVKENDPDFTGDIYFTLDSTDKYWPVNMDGGEIFRKDKDIVYDKLKAARQKAKEEVAAINTTHDVWKELGQKFCELRYSKSYQTHCAKLKVYDNKYHVSTDGVQTESYYYKYRDKEYDKYEDWDWIEKKARQGDRSNIIKDLKKRKFEMIVPENLERVGGRDISVKSTEELKKAFNFRDIQTGSYVQTDPVSAKWHTDNIAAGFADLADVLGIRDDQVSLNGRLAMAIGARGHGKALAHYEPVERVINITKMKGGGSLAHEWFHSFDNLIAEAMNGGDISVFMSDEYRQTKAVRLVDAFKPDAYHDPIPTDASTQKVKEKFNNLVKAMMEGDTPETEVISYKDEDITAATNFFESTDTNIYSYYGDNFSSNLRKAKTLDEAIDIINAKYKTSVDLILANAGKMERLSKYEQKRMKTTVKNFETWRKFAAAYFGSKNNAGGEVEVKTGRIVSRFYQDSKKLDGGKDKPYWSTPIEMAARSFEAYLVDKLKAQGRKNDYLSGHANNDEYQGEYYPYPTERDRVKINKAFDELFEIIRSENAIRKALDVLDTINKSNAYNPGIIEDGKIYLPKRFYL